MSRSAIWIGCCGWPMARTHYFKRFRTVELQSTFYQPPAVKLAEKWRREAPEDFRFCLKAWQLITHPASSPTYRKLKTPLPEKSKARVGNFQPTDEVNSAWQTTRELASALNAAVILFQCPASFRPEERNIRNLEAFFRRIPKRPYLLAWEPRGNWPADLVRDLCTRLKLIHCVDPLADKPATAGTCYFRLHGRGGHRYRYSEGELRELGEKLLAGRDRETYIMFNNAWMKDDAIKLQTLTEKVAIDRRRGL